MSSTKQPDPNNSHPLTFHPGIDSEYKERDLYNRIGRTFQLQGRFPILSSSPLKDGLDTPNIKDRQTMKEIITSQFNYNYPVSRSGNRKQSPNKFPRVAGGVLVAKFSCGAKCPLRFSVIHYYDMITKQYQLAYFKSTPQCTHLSSAPEPKRELSRLIHMNFDKRFASQTVMDELRQMDEAQRSIYLGQPYAKLFTTDYRTVEKIKKSIEQKISYQRRKRKVADKNRAMRNCH